MSGEANDDGRTGGGVTQPSEADSRHPRLEGTVVRYDDRPDECTIHPTDPTEGERTTAWITAKEGSYVCASAWR